MKVFLSWSGERSQKVAEALNDWLPLMFGDAVEPWMSKADIDAGKRWSSDLAAELAASNVGILCLTPENIASKWVLFEAGALAKSLDTARVIPLLFHLQPSEITAPLSDFQAKTCDKDGIKDVVLSINKSVDKPEDEDLVKRRFDALWSNLSTKLEEIPDVGAEKQNRPQTEVLEELVAGVRALEGRFRDLERCYDDGAVSRMRTRRFHPMMFEELMSMAPREPEDYPSVLVMVAGFVGNDFPWVRELLLDAARELRGCDPRAAEEIIERLRHMVHMSTRHPMMMMDYAGSKEPRMMSMELPMMLDHFFSRYEPPRRKPIVAKINTEARRRMAAKTKADGADVEAG